MDTVEFTAYVEARRPALLRAARVIARHPHDAEDLLQSVLINVAGRWERIADPAAADAYVRRAMANQLVSWSRVAWRSRECTRAVLPECAAPDATLALGYAGDSEEIWRAVVGLPLRQRQVVALRYYEGLSEAEIAALLGCSAGTVKSSAARGLATLRRTLAPLALPA